MNHIAGHRYYPSTDHIVMDKIIEKLEASKNPFIFTKQQYQDSLLPTEYGVRFKELNDFYTNGKQLSIDNALEDYILHTYRKSKEDIMKVFSKFHNVKVKGFESFIFKDNTNVVTYYYDKSWLFLTVIEYCSEYKIIKHWEDLV